MEIQFWYKANNEHDSRRKTIGYHCNNDWMFKGNAMLEIQFWYRSNEEHAFKVIQIWYY